ncbi:hypothetical protein [Dendronalium sp. ChiSLP03b]|uniref:hypothetical protein n=1 Tax=Dendronalium sp. ChiSLP03b TaxID=3075381 RepID=UPI002AD2BA72|nr:hypothetical protein [Dendronalium sp. ChiSLP03b]MDZ8207374.1 hypothetical protein [Dendronalium sp. ChiSLP03b]
MSNILFWVKGFGVATVSAIAFSGNSAIALINQDATLLNYLNTSNSSSVLENHNISGDNAIKSNSSINRNQTQLQNQDAVEKQEAQNILRQIPSKKILLADCWYDADGNRICR